MKTLALKKRVAGAALAVVAMFGVMVATSATAQAQYRGYGYDQQVRWDKDRTRAYAFALGYHTAYSEAQEARRRGLRIDYDDSYGYRNDTNGWLAWMGYESDYRRSYRDGFKDGFKDSMNGRARRYGRDEVQRLLGANPKDVYGDDRYDRDGYWNRDDYWRNRRGYRGNNSGYSRDNGNDGRYDRNEIMRIARQNGYRDGFAEGRQDAAQRRRHNLNDSRAYRDGLRGYQSQYGDRDLYRRAYREGFQQGYAEGYRNPNNNRGPRRRP